MPGGQPLDLALRNVVREIDRRLALAADHAQAVRLMTAAFILTGLRVGKETLSSIYDGVTIMHETSAYDAMVEEGIFKGILKARIAALLKLGRQRFGDPNRMTEAALTAIEDSDRLERMLDVILNVKSWKALLLVK